MIDEVTYRCPHCGHPQTAICSVQVLRDLPAGKMTKRVLDLLVEWFEKGRKIPAKRLVTLTWQNEIDGGPDHASNCMTVAICRLRARLEGDVGWTILSSGSGRRDCSYILAPVDRRSKITRDLHTTKYRKRVVPDKKKRNKKRQTRRPVKDLEQEQRSTE